MHRRTSERARSSASARRALVADDALVRGAVLEKKLMAMCDHPFVGKLLNTYRDDARLYMLLEFFPGGNLCDVPRG